jgi:glycosyltransferase involved in cell wall biosynthesis
MARKKRILWCGEASFLKTGYGVYADAVLKRLYKTGKYDIAELASYGNVDDERRYDVPWRYYGNSPDTPEEHQEYNARMPSSQFGDWRFEETCLHFKPDIVIDIRDWWMMEHECRSPFRKLYHWAIMPTVDSFPQQEQFLSTFLDADSVFTYSEWGRDVLEKQSEGKIKVVDIASPGADMNIMKPVPNKSEHRQAFGFVDNVNIIGTVMRNQKRKLYPDLIESFGKLLKNHPNLANNTFLYLHCSYPDPGWDIPLLVKESGLGHKIMFTYKCGQCRYFFPSFFQDARMGCPRCHAPSAILANSEVSVEDEELAQIINWFDVYVQYSICEGFGMPQVEAAACGVPIMAVDYSAMESVVRNLKGYPIKVDRYFRESETMAFRAYPDNDHLVELLAKFLAMPNEMRMRKGRDAYMQANKLYNWDRTAKIWEKHLDSIEIDERSWEKAAHIHHPTRQVPGGLSTEELIRWGIKNIWGQPDMVDSYVALRMIRDLNYRNSIVGTGGVYFNEASYLSHRNQYESFNEQIAMDRLMGLCEKRNYWEQRRAGLIDEGVPSFIQQSKPGILEE